MMSCLRPSPKADILPGTSGGSSFTKRFGMPMAARADFSEKYLTPESGLPKAHNLSSVLAFSNGQSPVIVRYADDAVIGFQHRHEAERFLKDLREHLRQYGLELNEEKTRLIRFGR